MHPRCRKKNSILSTGEQHNEVVSDDLQQLIKSSNELLESLLTHIVGFSRRVIYRSPFPNCRQSRKPFVAFFAFDEMLKLRCKPDRLCKYSATVIRTKAFKLWPHKISRCNDNFQRILCIPPDSAATLIACFLSLFWQATLKAREALSLQYCDNN